MADTSKRELIEQAAKGIRDAARDLGIYPVTERGVGASRTYARAALAVFEAHSKDFRVAESEQAQAPTDIRYDEDGQHVYWFDPVEGCWVAFRRVDCVGEEELPDRRLPRVEQAQAPSDEERMVIYANSNVTRGKFAAAAVHAALTAVGAHHGGPVIVLGAKPTEIEKHLTVIRDAGKTEVEPGTVTAGTDWPAAALMPLLNRVRAEALREAAKPFMDRLNGEGNGRAYNSYTVARLLRERAEAIEQNSEGNET